MLQTGLRDILSSIVGRIAALGHALAAHDIALGRSHGSRAWAAWKRTWGFGHHQHVMPSVFAPYAVSRAAPAPHARWPNECAIGHACRIVAIHASGRFACAHGRRLRKWRRLLAGKGEGFTAREQLALAVTLDTDLRSRDTLIVTAISPEVSMKQLRVMVEERYSLKSTALLERVLEGWFHAGQKPDTSRLDLAVDILAGFVERVPQSRRAQLLTVCAYLSWSAGHVGRAAEWGLKALLADEECTLAALVVTACEHGTLPDWAL